jgi:hypothetical protein
MTRAMGVTTCQTAQERHNHAQVKGATGRVVGARQAHGRSGENSRRKLQNVVKDSWDVNLGSSIATVRDGKFFKSRLVPLAPQLVGVLAEYWAWRQAKYPSRDPKAGFFVGPGGTRLSKAGLDVAFVVGSLARKR